MNGFVRPGQEQETWLEDRESKKSHVLSDEQGSDAPSLPFSRSVAVLSVVRFCNSSATNMIKGASDLMLRNSRFKFHVGDQKGVIIEDRVTLNYCDMMIQYDLRLANLQGVSSSLLSPLISVHYTPRLSYPHVARKLSQNTQHQLQSNSLESSTFWFSYGIRDVS